MSTFDALNKVRQGVMMGVHDKGNLLCFEC